MANKQYDLVVLGAGPGGYVAAIRAAQLGLSVAIIEKEYWGGVCLNVGCIPSKALLHNAELAHTLQHRAKEFGFSFDNLTLNWNVAWKRSRQVSARLVKGVQFLMRKNNIDTYEGIGAFTDAHTLKVTLNKGGEETVQAKNVIIATGARPRQLPGADFDGERIISYVEGILAEQLKEKVVIIGGGVIGVEFAYMWANYGVDVTILEMMDHLLPMEDPESSDVLEKAYKKMGVKFQLGARVEKVEKTAVNVKVSLADGTSLEADQVMVAINFVPNTEGIGLENTGVALTQRGNIQIDEFMRTNVAHIFAIGDVATDYRLAHIASAMGMVAAETIAGHATEPLNYKMLPRATYCVPQVASFGYTEKEAQELGYEVKVGRFNFQANGKALGLGERDGFVKIIADAKYGEILGASMVGPNVTELLPELTLAHNQELTAEEIARNVHAHPTLSEALMEAAHGVEGNPIHA
ncbi:MAG: dihydrolipoyl dehydrogenase [Ardenticatenaceae bacterium]|nr:dihydrolipoyl dehydrogenase [Anaerolineales bacterium]MCB8921208.1 dihydrolipoyl dehydrogenase [Ardenticatenaceae bacterium]MCB8992173.1 dihydrolipoyl dehydrogenase [Ardenticatenaceae bacterium]MCB9004280.1 dihydrolipoyl dehydrogenase [Ardenticatenaceae bacterium]